MATVVVGGAVANKLHNGGEAWVRLSWIRGLQRLGLDVWFVEQIDSATCVDGDGTPAPFGESENRRYFEAVMAEFGLTGRASLLYENGREAAGLSLDELAGVAAEADLLVNISGHLQVPALMRLLRRKAYVDLDPGFTQFWHADGWPGLGGHDSYLHRRGEHRKAGMRDPDGRHRLAARCRRRSCSTIGRVAGDGGFGSFTTVGAWRGSFGVIERDGRTYGLKVHEFRKVIELPTKVPFRFEIALDIYPGDDRDRESLEANGWHLVSPAEATRGPLEFRRFVQDSGAEFSVAQGIYVDTNSGWFSDRSVRYLASGRPTLLQDTGFSDNYQVGEGLVAFRTVAEAAAGAQRIAADYEGHRAAARALAEERFDSDKVLPRFLAEAGLSP